VLRLCGLSDRQCTRNEQNGICRFETVDGEETRRDLLQDDSDAGQDLLDYERFVTKLHFQLYAEKVRSVAFFAAARNNKN
jgi:hypothetical protein